MWSIRKGEFICLDRFYMKDVKKHHFIFFKGSFFAKSLKRGLVNKKIPSNSRYQNQRFLMKKLKQILHSEDAKDLYVLVSMVGCEEFLSKRQLLRAIHDKAKPNAYSSWMDKGSNIHGQFHRLYHGHDFVSNIVPFIKKFGIKKIPYFLYELTKDSLTKNGLPIGGVQFLANNKIINKNILNSYGSLNIGDFSAGSIALVDSYRFFKQYKKGFKSKDLSKGGVRVIFKISYGIYRKNPLLVMSGVIDSAVLGTWFLKTGKQIKENQNWLNSQYKKSIKQCNRIKKGITTLQSEWEKDKKQQKAINDLFNEAMKDNIKIKLKVIEGGKNL